jgi:hypothetical protein
MVLHLSVLQVCEINQLKTLCGKNEIVRKKITNRATDFKVFLSIMVGLQKLGFNNIPSIHK